ncbi:hypothetical protein F5882DRAFT_375361 [Hyaloscypha sp. PMI_1271]|nr:hypothetical protein F5882DRAFT_375361 [Hyaloscypha sp. PMI_1271]
MGMNSDVNPRDRQCISNSATRTSKYSTRVLNPKTYPAHDGSPPKRFLEAFYLLFRVNHGSSCIPTVSGREASCIQPGAQAGSILRHRRSGCAPATNATSNNRTLPALCFTTLRSGTIQVPADGFSPRLRIQCWAAAVLEWMLVEEHKAAGQREKQRTCLVGKTVSMGYAKQRGFRAGKKIFGCPAAWNRFYSQRRTRAQPFEFWFEGGDNNNIRGRRTGSRTDRRSNFGTFDNERRPKSAGYWLPAKAKNGDMDQ